MTEHHSPDRGTAPSLWSRRGLLNFVALQDAPLDLRLLGRTLLHAALVGLTAGLVGVVFLLGLEQVEHLLLVHLAGFAPLRAGGEHPAEGLASSYRPWLLLLLPGLGALVGGFFTRWAPETRGGGGDAAIDAFHHDGGRIRRRVLLVKPLASLFTLGTGGAGGREGPTMQLGGAIGSLVGSLLRATARERRILMVAGVAAGISAVFRTPLGAALLAIEVLYRDDFEAEALIPAVLASVVSYSVAITLLGESTLFGKQPHFQFVPGHLYLYLLLALITSLAAMLFVRLLDAVRRVAQRLPGPAWARPAFGGFGLGIVAVAAIGFADWQIHMPGQGLGLLGGGYGAAQLAMTGASWFPKGWTAVELLALLALGKIVASSLTIGTGGSAGDFAPALAIGGLIGGAFGLAASLVLHDPRISPAAFVLVGMGTFYGGVAHVPLAALVLVSEISGSYDLLVPLMFAEGVALVLLRRTMLYHAQLVSAKDSPTHQVGASAKVLAQTRVIDVLPAGRTFVTFAPSTPILQVVEAISDNHEQDAFPVIADANKMVGMVTANTLRYLASHREIEAWAVAADVMEPPSTLRFDTDLRTALLAMNERGLRELPVLDDEGAIVGLLDEQDAAAVLLSSNESHHGANSAPARPAPP